MSFAEENRIFKSMENIRRAESLANLDIECPICKGKVLYHSLPVGKKLNYIFKLSGGTLRETSFPTMLPFLLYPLLANATRFAT